MEKMLVTQALNELKTLDSRIYRAIRDALFIAEAKISDSKVNPAVTKENFIKDAKASYDSIEDLIKRREIIKSAVIESNAKTMIEICGEKISVAKAIDMKDSITYKKQLLTQMTLQRDKAKSDMISHNITMENKIDQLVSTAFGKESKQNIKPEDYESIAVPYRKANECSLVDPLKLDKKIENLERYIEDFEANIDSKLQVSNCVTYIEV